MQSYEHRNENYREVPMGSESSPPPMQMERMARGTSLPNPPPIKTEREGLPAPWKEMTPSPILAQWSFPNVGGERALLLPNGSGTVAMAVAMALSLPLPLPLPLAVAVVVAEAVNLSLSLSLLLAYSLYPVIFLFFSP